MDQELALGESALGKPPGFENLFALEQGQDIGEKSLDETLALRQLVKACPELGEHGALCGAPGRGELEETLGPSDQAVQVHEPCLGLGLRGDETCEDRLLELAGDTSASRHENFKHRVLAIAPFDEIGDKVGDIVYGETSMSSLPQQSRAFLKIGPTVLEVGRGIAHDRNDTLEKGGDRLASPGIGHRHGDTMHAPKAGSAGADFVVTGIESQDGQNLSGPESDAGVDHPDESIGGRCACQGRAVQLRGGLDAHQGEPGYPIDDGLRTRCVHDPKCSGEQGQNSGYSSKADMTHEKQLQGQRYDIHLVHDGWLADLGLKLAETGPGFLELLLELIALLRDPFALFSLAAQIFTTLHGLGLPSLQLTLLSVGFAHRPIPPLSSALQDA